MILLDTDHLSVLVDQRASANSALVRKLEQSEVQLAIPIVAVEEQWRGWLAKLRHVSDIQAQVQPYQRLVQLLDFLAEWIIVPFTPAAAEQFAQFRRQRIRIGSQDLRIAAIATSEDALLLSANLRDFQIVPGLNVENWLRD